MTSEAILAYGVDPVPHTKNALLTTGGGHRLPIDYDRLCYILNGYAKTVKT